MQRHSLKNPGKHTALARKRISDIATKSEITEKITAFQEFLKTIKPPLYDHVDFTGNLDWTFDILVEECDSLKRDIRKMRIK